MPSTTIAPSKKRCKKKNVKETHHKNKPLTIGINAKTIKEMFPKRMINTMAQTSGFIQRKRKLIAYDFFYL